MDEKIFRALHGTPLGYAITVLALPLLLVFAPFWSMRHIRTGVRRGKKLAEIDHAPGRFHNS